MGAPFGWLRTTMVPHPRRPPHRISPRHSASKTRVNALIRGEVMELAARLNAFTRRFILCWRLEPALNAPPSSGLRVSDTDHAIAGDDCSELLPAPVLGARGAPGENEVAKVG